MGPSYDIEILTSLCNVVLLDGHHVFLFSDNVWHFENVSSHVPIVPIRAILSLMSMDL